MFVFLVWFGIILGASTVASLLMAQLMRDVNVVPQPPKHSKQDPKQDSKQDPK